MRSIFFSFIILSIAVTLFAQESRLLRFPNASKDQITFVYAGDIYVVSKNGGLARKITSSEGIEMFPRFSPDGKTIAFTAEYDGNRDIYLIPSQGGEPKRLTYSMDIPNLPERMGPDQIIMHWTPDGKKILYRSRHESWHAWSGQLFLVSVDGGLPEKIKLPRSGFASLSPDGNKIAYNRVFREFRTWKRYRGGQADDIWIYDFNTKKLENITNNPAQDIIPMWHKDKVYYISDRDHTMNLFCYNLTTKENKKITNFDKYDVKFPSIGTDYIAFENGGYIYLMDLNTEKVEKVTIQIAEDFPIVRNTIKNVKENIQSFEISPDGKRALFSSRGEIFTVPAEKGNIRNLTNSPGVHDRNPVWSPDGRWIAYVSDESGEDEIYIIKPDGSGKTRISSDGNVYRYGIKWSPDSKKLLCSDKSMQLYYYDIDTKKRTNITKSKVWEITDFTWSPDSKWIAFTDAPNVTNNSIILYSLADGKTTNISNPFFDSYFPCFSEDGKYLFFVSDRTFNATISNIEWNPSFNNMSTIFGVPLQDSLKTPFVFESDEAEIITDQQETKEPAKDKKTDKKDEKSKDEKAAKNKDIIIHLDGIADRVFELPISPGNYYNLTSVGNKLYYVKSGLGRKAVLNVFDLVDRKESEVGDFSAYEISANRKKILFQSGGDYYISDLKEKINTSSGKLNLNNMELEIDRKAEWKQIFDESWRQMRDFLYDPNMHGVDWKAIGEKYAELLPYVNHRFDLTYIIGEMIGEINIGHAYVGGGDMPKVKPVQIGLLGAEFELDKASGFYKITKIYQGRNWEEKTRSPLTEPGINIKEGDYLISIDGIKLSQSMHPFKALVNKSNKFVKIKVNSKPTETGAKEFDVKTISSEAGLRYFNWVEDNRKKVDLATNGRVAYVHIPDMAVNNGLNEFVRYFYPQVRKEALIVDDRFNGGGNVSPMIIERLRRVLVVAKNARNQEIVLTNPDAVMTGPMVCLLNELSASDGDLFPYQFKKLGLGKLIGKRSWGGVIGIRGSMPFIDGGYLMRPEFANFGADGTWILEGVGMIPDIEVDNDPALEWEGTDQQLNKAIEVILEEIKTDKKPKIPAVPPYPIKK